MLKHLIINLSISYLIMLYWLRCHRGGMVQTAEQYEFIHRALALYEASLPISATD